jgi:dATP pyrophosphohydrolase
VARAPFQVLVLPYRRNGRGLEVAVLRRADYDLWQFVSGGGEEGETPETAARREAHEEAGAPLDAPLIVLDSMTMIPACWFHEWSTWPPEVRLVPEHAFAIEVGDHPLALSDEHVELRWTEPAAAMELLRFDSNKNALWELHERLFPGPRIKRPAYR